MAGTELAVVRDEPAAVAQRDIVDGWVERAASVFKLADHICDTDFVPDAYRGNAPAVAAAILAGRELGIGPMTSLRHVQVVKGNPSLSAEYKRARVLAAGHEFTILEINTQRCRVKGKRRGSSEPPLEIKFDMADAKIAGLLNPSRSGKPGAWQTRPRRMLFARAASELCDLMFSDVVNGLATTDLLAEGTDEDAFAGYDEPDGQQAPKPAAQKARRKTEAGQGTDKSGTAQRATGSLSGSESAQAHQPPAASPDLPPLPGEEDETPAAAGEDETPGPAPSGQPAGQEPAAGPGNDRHRKLVGIVRAHFKRLGYTDGDDTVRLEHTAVLAGTSELGSTNDLDEDELKAVADTLARCKNVDALKVLLDAAQKAKAGDGDD